VVKEGSWMVGGYDDLGHEAEVSIWQEAGYAVVQGQRFWKPRRSIEVAVPKELLELGLVVTLMTIVSEWHYHLWADMTQILGE